MPKLYGHLQHHLFELAVAVVFGCAGASYLLEPELLATSPVGREVQPFASIWCCGYLAAAALIVVGLTRRSPRVRAAGLMVLGFSLLMNAGAAFTYDLSLRVVVYPIYAAACLARVAYLLRAEAVTRDHSA